MNKSLAWPRSDNAASMLTTAINTLLGIDLVDRLEKDLVVYERDISKDQHGGQGSSELTQREAKHVSFQEELRNLLFEKGKLQNETDQLQKRVEKEEANFRRQGGDLFARRKELGAQRESARAQLDRIEHEMREIAAGVAPLLIVNAQVADVCNQAQREESAEQQRLMLAELEKRDRAILRAASFPAAAQNKLDALFSADRKRREHTTKIECFLNLDKSAIQSLERITPSVFEEIRKRCSKLTREYAQLNEQVMRIDETLARVPDEAAIAQASEELAIAQKNLVKKQVESSMLTEQIEKMRRLVEEQERAIANILEQNVIESAAKDDASRKIKFAAKVRETMKQFRIRVLERKIKQIENLILESFQQLVRKKDFVSAIKIDPKTYRMTLYRETGHELHADRLSAGERQLLAISTLWGLARASGRPLPTIIDTPLGRLDSHHRSNLVENYFPYASHQVIILSTDEEIGSKHLATLHSRITRTFELSYSPETQSTAVVPGYFFN
ncbi:MAG: DNA sulfur modification protein DndD [Nibricoccus sp.]